MVEAIRTHRFRDNVAPQTLEARILYDADKLDAIGAIGVARAYAMSGMHETSPCGPRFPPIMPDASAHRVEGMPRARGTPRFTSSCSSCRDCEDTLFTDAAKRIAEERHRFMDEFFAAIKRGSKRRAMTEKTSAPGTLLDWIRKILPKPGPIKAGPSTQAKIETPPNEGLAPFRISVEGTHQQYPGQRGVVADDL